MKKHHVIGKYEIKNLADGGIIFSMKSDSGEVMQTCYNVFSGINVIYNDIRLKNSFACKPEKNGRFIEINYCQKGRLEHCAGDELFYISSGDISIHKPVSEMYEEKYPTGHYQGITIQLDLDRTPHCFSEILEDITIQPEQLAEKFRLNEQRFYIMRQFPNIQHIFSGFYDIPDGIRKGYLKVKALELLLFLSTIKPEKIKPEQRSFTAAKEELARKISAYICDNLSEQITLLSLSERFSVSEYSIKTAFRDVYGMTAAEYIRTQRMNKAAVLLSTSDITVLEAAAQTGYENGSKFAAVFRKTMGMTPCAYRRSHYRKK